jgi:hypothetical protein
MTAPLECPDCCGWIVLAGGVADVYHTRLCPSRRDAGASVDRWLADRLADEGTWLPDYAVYGEIVPVRHQVST